MKMNMVRGRGKIFQYLKDNGSLFGVQSLLRNLKFEGNSGVSSNVNWTPVYITGQEGFSEEVFHSLEKSEAVYMPGYLYDNNLASEHAMYWVPEKSNLRDFKNAVGAGLIWKYRLRFYTDLEKFTSSLHPEEGEIFHAA